MAVDVPLRLKIEQQCWCEPKGGRPNQRTPTGEEQTLPQLTALEIAGAFSNRKVAAFIRWGEG